MKSMLKDLKALEATAACDENTSHTWTRVLMSRLPMPRNTTMVLKKRVFGRRSISTICSDMFRLQIVPSAKTTQKFDDHPTGEIRKMIESSEAIV